MQKRRQSISKFQKQSLRAILEGKKRRNKIGGTSKVWFAEIMAKECSFCKDSGKDYAIFLPWNIYGKLYSVVRQLDTEWMVYLEHSGRVEERGVVSYTPTGIVVPDQQVKKTNVVAVNSPEGRRYGVVHAHQFSTGSRGFRSGDDRTMLDSNNDFSLIINGDGFVFGVIREKLPCNLYKAFDAEVIIDFPDMDFEDPIVEEVRSHIIIPPPPKEEKKGVIWSYGDLEDYQYTPNIVPRGRPTFFPPRIQGQDIYSIECPVKGHEDQCKTKDYWGCMRIHAECPYKGELGETDVNDQAVGRGTQST